jgi:hypothetical protein
MNKVFRVAHIARDDDEANEFMRTHPDTGVIAHDSQSGLIFIAELHSLTVPSGALPD